MNHDLFCGEKVRLVAIDSDQMTGLFSQAFRDSEFSRLLDTGPARLYSSKAHRKFIEEELAADKPNLFPFMIRTIQGDQLIGEIDLHVTEWTHRDAFVGIGIVNGYQGRGYGTDAMRLVLRYAFTELNLARVTLNVFEYNPRAIRSYEKAGFKVEGRQRGFINREGKRYNLIYMGILYDEWMEHNNGR
ncbi:MAG: GNAT family protein [Chloroflexota bacterium]